MRKTPSMKTSEAARMNKEAETTKENDKSGYAEAGETRRKITESKSKRKSIHHSTIHLKSFQVIFIKKAGQDQETAHEEESCCMSADVKETTRGGSG